MIFSFFIENNDENLGFETFLQLFQSILDRHIPIKKWKRKKENIKSKPWVTKGLSNSAIIRDKLYKPIIKEKYESTKNMKPLKKITLYASKQL